MKNEKITILLVEPEKRPKKKIIKNNLETLQSLVGGYIQVIYPFDDMVGIIVNEEGKILNLQFNRRLFDENNEAYDYIAGSFLVVGLSEENFDSLSDELIEKYKKYFYKYEIPFKFADGELRFYRF